MITDSGADGYGHMLKVSTGGNPFASARGGTVTVTSGGRFTYSPPAGYAGPDSFSFTVTNGYGRATGTADITIANYKVWYVNHALATNGTGTSASPFNALSSVGPASGAGDFVFLFGSATSYPGGITLQASQTLTGQSAALTVNGRTVSAGHGPNPTITNSGGAGVTLAEGATIKGVNVSGTSGAGITGAVDDATIASGITVSGTTGYGLAITGGSGGTITDGAAISNSSGEGAEVTGRTGGTVSQTGPVTGSILLSSNTGARISFKGKITASTGPTGGVTVTGDGSGGTIYATGRGTADTAAIDIGTRQRTACNAGGTAVTPKPVPVGPMGFADMTIEAAATPPGS